MARIDGVDPAAADEHVRKGLDAPARTGGAPLLNHLLYARRSSIFRGVRAMWTGLDASGLPSQRLWKREG